MENKVGLIRHKNTEVLSTSSYFLIPRDPYKNKQAGYQLKNYFSWEKESTIFSIYKKPCTVNINAYYRIRNDMLLEHGYDLRCGNQTYHSWCCAYRIKAANNEYLIYHTRDHVYCVIIGEFKNEIL